MFKMFKWVPDGVYDYQEFLVRYEIKDGSYVWAACKDWVDKGGPISVPQEYRKPWGAFPDFPPRPPKKVD